MCASKTNFCQSISKLLLIVGLKRRIETILKQAIIILVAFVGLGVTADCVKSVMERASIEGEAKLI